MEKSEKLHNKAQLDKSEREEIEEVVYQMRERVENYYRHVLEEEFDLDSKPENEVTEEKRQELVTAIERELTEDKSWKEAINLYIKGMGYTLVNRLAALRCMEVRDFVDREITQFRESRTPAADPLVEEEFMDDNEAIIEAYKRECDRLAEEIEILFDLSDPYSVLDPKIDLFRDLCELLDEIDDDLWLADDVLGWVYEYYNAPDLEDVREKARNEGLDPEDTTVANQFYTPHWVVRMLTDNSLGKLFLEYKGSLQDTIKKQQDMFSVEDRKNRSTHPEDAPSITELCTYLVPTEEEGEATDFEHPSDIRVLDPACGSGHFLLYAFDILERIWWEETDVDRGEIPGKILENNLFGVDLDLRACQLAAFNLYLKGRSRAEDEGNDEFTIPQIGIVCADSHIADVEEAEEVFEEVAGDQPELKKVLENILEEFQTIPGLGSLLDVKGTLSEEFLEENTQSNLSQFKGEEYKSLRTFLDALHKEIEEKHSNGKFLAQDLQSFLRLVKILSQKYDVSLMNPPYGARNRMPRYVKGYVKENYKYGPEYYINFFELCERISTTNGYIGMLVPRSFMFKRSFQKFRGDFVKERGSFDFLAEYGLGVLDNATVYTAGTVVRSNKSENEDPTGKFIRLHDADTHEKEEKFLKSIFSNFQENTDSVQRFYTCKASEFEKIPGFPLTYWVPQELRSIYESKVVLDAENAGVSKESLGVVKQGLATGDDSRFVRYFWESKNNEWIPFSKGGEYSWIFPKIGHKVWWSENGEEIKRYSGSRPQNRQHYFNKSITYNAVKTKSGRRFGYLNENSIFSHKGPVISPTQKRDIWSLISYLNSNLVTYLMLCQTPERMWEISEVSKLPWDEGIETQCGLRDKAKEIAGLILSYRRYELTSPYYIEPLVLQVLNFNMPLNIHQNHSHRNFANTLSLVKPEPVPKNVSIFEIYEKIKSYWEELSKLVNEKNREINQEVFDYFDIDKDQQKGILTEIDLRMGENPRDADLVPDLPKLSQLIKKLLHHLVLKIAQDDKDGVVPLLVESGKEELDLLIRTKKKFKEIWGEYAEERLAEADQILGNRQSGDKAYPNIRHWLENELFEFHLQEFENTPIIWKLTTDRLVSDPEGTGFSCLIDYHQLNEDIFDTLKSRYLEPRKSALREKGSTADRRRSDPSLDAAEQAEATDEYNRCQSALRQIEELEQKMKELSQVHEREWSEENQKKAEKLVPKVREFRERLEERLSTLDELRETADYDWLEDTFSPTFFDRVDDNKEEWIDALKDLEKAFRAYSKDASTPVEAHLYDLFPYFADKLTGTTHYGSNGIFFMNYYFSKGKEYLEDGEPREGMAEHLRLFAELAVETDQDVELGEEIIEDCKELEKAIPSDWKDRAISEVMTGGYSPVKKHGVAINIEPLANKNIVPKIVDDKVIL